MTKIHVNVPGKPEGHEIESMYGILVNKTVTEVDDGVDVIVYIGEPITPVKPENTGAQESNEQDIQGDEE